MIQFVKIRNRVLRKADISIIVDGAYTVYTLFQLKEYKKVYQQALLLF